MRRADRLFLLIQALRRRRRAVTGRVLADELGIALRTLYRDVAALQARGVPIDGEAGVGYRLRAGADLPPLMFDADEATALVLGLRMVQMAAPPAHARAAHAALRRIAAVAPDGLFETARAAPLWTPGSASLHRIRPVLASVDEALRQRRLLSIGYVDAAGRRSERDVEPLLLAFWGDAWTLGAWCRLRDGFRDFRVDRVVEPRVLDAACSTAPERSLEAYKRHLAATSE